MRIILLIGLISIYFPSFGQDTIFPQIKLQSAYSGANPYLELLSISDKDALIIKAALNTESNSEEGSYVAFLSNGDIHKYGIFSIKDETIVKHVSVCSLAEKQSLYNKLQVANWLNQSQLNIKEIVSNEVSTQVYVNDGDTYYLTLYKGNRFSHFQSEAPYEYIEAKVKGHEMRSGFLELFNAIDFKNTIAAKSIDEIRTRDTVFVYYQNGAYESRLIMHQTGSAIYQFRIDKDQEFNFDEIKNNNITITDKKELERIRQEMIDYDFFFKYGAEVQFLKSKKVFVVNALELSSNKVRIKKSKSGFSICEIISVIQT